jgi:hypothetical protein
MYNVPVNLPFESKDAGFMDVGIHENVELTRVEYGKTSNEFIAFYFVGADGSKLSYTAWKPSLKGDETAERLVEKELNQMSNLKQIVSCFIPSERFAFPANDYEDFAKKIIELLGTTFVGVKLRVKVVYSGKYTSLPQYWKPRFIERMDNNGSYGDKQSDKSKIKMLSIDIKERKADPIPTNTNPFATTQNAPSLTTNEIPF